jgi:hypothetical protein
MNPVLGDALIRYSTSSASATYLLRLVPGVPEGAILTATMGIVIYLSLIV